VDVQAERWLGDGQALGGAPKVQLLGQHQEIAQMTEFHKFKKCIDLSVINIRQLFMKPQQSPTRQPLRRTQVRV
jgi:hypothetical protein